jgi:hypothetical protein
MRPAVFRCPPPEPFLADHGPTIAGVGRPDDAATPAVSYVQVDTL